MLVTAVDVVDAANDNALLAPMVEQAEETTGTRAPWPTPDISLRVTWQSATVEVVGRNRVPSRAAGGGNYGCAYLVRHGVSMRCLNMSQVCRLFYHCTEDTGPNSVTG